MPDKSGLFLVVSGPPSHRKWNSADVNQDSVARRAVVNESVSRSANNIKVDHRVIAIQNSADANQDSVALSRVINESISLSAHKVDHRVLADKVHRSRSRLGGRALSPAGESGATRIFIWSQNPAADLCLLFAPALLHKWSVPTFATRFQSRSDRPSRDFRRFTDDLLGHEPFEA